MSQFINTTQNLVTDALDGLLRTQPLSRLDGYPHVKVVFRRNADSNTVALVSGGGSGHEPAHAGFIAEGLLNAAVCGEVFASPSVDAVLAGILSVTGDAGCLLIVKNYTGDRLNFGMAAERAKAMGKRVEMVVIGDDIALPDLPQPRGVAGTLFVHKIAGCLAARGESLDVVAGAAREVAGAVRSYGVALDNCTVPGNSKDARVPAGKAELGLGIHGEPGVQTIDYSDARSVCSLLMEKLEDTGIAGESHVMLLNNLGGTTPLEMQVVLTSLLGSPHGERVTAVIGPAALMTSLDMHGFSVSLLPARDAWMNALNAPVHCAAWPGCCPVGPVDIQPMPVGWQTSASHEASQDDFLYRLLSDSCAAFMQMQDDLNALDAKTGDGDTGTTLARAAASLIQSINKLPLADTPALLRAISDQISISMGGSSGVLLAILFSAASDAMRAGLSPVAAIREGVSRMMVYGGAEVGDRTMVDALVPALDELLHSGDEQQAAVAARQGADATRLMNRARSGRSATVPATTLQGVTDPGAEAVARFFDVLASAALHRNS